MTFSEAFLLNRLKKAQIVPDRISWINYDELTLTTVGDSTEKIETVSVSCYRGSIQSALKSLEESKYINVFGCNIQVTHKGWHAFQFTVQSAVRFTVRDVFVPIIVASAASWLPSLLNFIRELIGSMPRL